MKDLNYNTKEELYEILVDKYGKVYADKCAFNSLKENLRSRCYSAFNKLKLKKSFSTHKLLKADFKTVKEHLEKQFDVNMNWYNMSREGWHIDHKFPLALACNEDQLKILLAFKNLQPMWQKDNILKSSFYKGVKVTYKNRHLFQKDFDYIKKELYIC